MKYSIAELIFFLAVIGGYGVLAYGIVESIRFNLKRRKK